MGAWGSPEREFCEFHARRQILFPGEPWMDERGEVHMPDR
jgi:hypothetical protein